MTAEERKKKLETGLDKMEAKIKEIREDIKNGRADNLTAKARHIKRLAFCLVYQADEYEAK